MRLLGPIALFAFGLALRLVFQAATPDGGVCWHIGFQGDAPVWQDLSARLAQGIADLEFRLPFRPPGMTYGIAALWDGEGATVWPVRFLFTVLGALVPVLFWLLLRRHVAAPVAWLAAVLCACASNLLLVSSGLHAETPYLVGVLLALLDQQRLVERGGAGVAVRLGILHGLLCLLRAEHVLAVLLLGAVAWWQGARWHRLLLVVAGMAVPLVPWQLHANRLVAAFNSEAPELLRSDVVWRDDAVARLRGLPGFQQGPMHRFVTDTLRVRGQGEVRAADLDVIRDAFGVEPEPIRPAFVAVQGAMNFWLASVPEGDGGYAGAALDRPPPLRGGVERYAPWLRRELPRDGKFSLNYPPHLDIFVHGYARGWAELAAEPWAALQRIGTKLWIGLAGATGGLGGAAWPIGLSGERRPVDMVAATGAWAGLWRVAVALVAAVGVWRLRGSAVVAPLLAFAVARLVVLAAFYGHARFGALLLPLTALGVAAVVHAVAQRSGRERWLPWLLVALPVAVLAVDLLRGRVEVHVDGQPFRAAPGGEAEYRPHVVTFG